MGYLEAAWDGSVEAVSDALRAGVHADTTSLVSDFGSLDTPLFFTYAHHTATATIITLIYIMRGTYTRHK